VKLDKLKVNFIGNPDPEEILGRCPNDGRHGMLMTKALVLRHNFFTASEAADMLRRWLNREPRKGEIEDVIKKAFPAEDDGYYTLRKATQWKPADPNRVIKLYHELGGWEYLSPQLGVVEQMTPAEWLSQMFNTNDYICVGYGGEESKKCTQTLPLSKWLNHMPHDAAYCSPSVFRQPVYHGRNEENVLWRQYCVFELDIKDVDKEGNSTVWTGALAKEKAEPIDFQSAVVLHLFSLDFPICSIVHSGNKTIHVWCSAKGLDTSSIREI
jgi:hypothetical protein